MIARILPFRTPLAKLPMRQFGSDFVRHACRVLQGLLAAALFVVTLILLLALTLPWLRVIA